MAKRIIDMVKAKKASMIKNPAEAGQNQTLAIAAMKGGIRSQEWRSYMMQFVEPGPTPGVPVNPDQLNRLLATDGTLGMPELDTKRAYMVGNATCGDMTTGMFDYQVDTIDVGIQPGCLQPPQPSVPKPTRKPKKAARKKAAKK